MLNPKVKFTDRFLLIEKIGAGGFSEVWKAEDLMAQNIVALKIFAPGRGLDSDGIEIFRREYNLVDNLNHSNLLTPKFFGIFDGQPYLVLRFMPNGSLKRKRGNLTEVQIIKFLNQACEALKYLHSQKTPIIHQDIKPDNFLLDENDTYLLSDFGISSEIRDTLTRTKTKEESESTIGSQAYMPPEKFSKVILERKPSPAGDIWALGVTVFELITKELAFGEHGGINQLRGEEAPNLPKKYPNGLNHLVNRMLSKNPVKRPTAKEILELLPRIKTNETDNNPSNTNSQQSFLNRVLHSMIIKKHKKPKVIPFEPRIGSRTYLKVLIDGIVKFLVFNGKNRSKVNKVHNDYEPSDIPEQPILSEAKRKLAIKSLIIYKSFVWTYLGSLIVFIAGAYLFEFRMDNEYYPQGPFQELGIKFVIFGLVLLFVALVLSFFILFNGWKSIQDKNSIIKPRQSVGRLFIPFYNFYWIFRAVRGLFIEMNNFNPKTKASVKYATFYCIISVIPVFNLAFVVLLPILMSKIKNNTIFVLTEENKPPILKREKQYKTILSIMVITFIISLFSFITSKTSAIQDYDYCMQRGDYYLEKNEFTEARNFFEKANSYDFVEDYKYNSPFKKLKEVDKAESNFTFNKYKTEGEGFLTNSRFEDARVSFKKANEYYDKKNGLEFNLNDRFCECFVKEGNTYLLDRNYQGAANAFQEALKHKPSDEYASLAAKFSTKIFYYSSKKANLDYKFIREEGNTYRYEGYSQDGSWNGWGKRQWKGKDVGFEYNGQWKNNYMTGYGIYTFPDGCIWIGYFENDEIQGKYLMHCQEFKDWWIP